MSEWNLILIGLAMVYIAYHVGQLRVESRKALQYPHCRHDNWHIDTQLKLLWCDACKTGNWYTIKSSEGANVQVVNSGTELGLNQKEQNGTKPERI